MKSSLKSVGSPPVMPRSAVSGSISSTRRRGSCVEHPGGEDSPSVGIVFVEAKEVAEEEIMFSMEGARRAVTDKIALRGVVQHRIGAAPRLKRTIGTTGPRLDYRVRDDAPE